MNTTTKTLLDFIDIAEKNREYPQGTALGRRAAVRLFDAELNGSERESLDTFKSYLDQIYQNVFNKNKSKMRAESLLTYKNRISALISDYEKYGTDPTKMASWDRPVRKRSARDNGKTENKTYGQDADPKQELESYKTIDMSRFELPLRAGVKAIILVPSNITKVEVIKIRKYIDFLESIAGTSPEESRDVAA